MSRTFLTITLAALSLAACSSPDDAASHNATTPSAGAAAQSPKKPVTPQRPKTDAEVKQEQLQVLQTVEQAMAAIPPELRQKHSEVFNCLAQRNTQLPAGQQKVLDASTINEITAALKANSNAQICS